MTRASASTSYPAPRPVTNEDYAHLVAINGLRATPHAITMRNGTTVSYPVSWPLTWSQPLANAANSYVRTCWQQACVTGPPSTLDLVAQQYAPGLGPVDMNVGFWSASAASPETSVIGLMSSPEHFGAMVAPAYWQVGTEPDGKPSDGGAGRDVQLFSRSRPASGVPYITAGAVEPRLPDTYGDAHARKLVMSYHDPAGVAPKSIVAVYGAKRIPLSVVAAIDGKLGKPGFANYGTTFDPDVNGCTPLHFESTPQVGPTARWPEREDILVGAGSAGTSCAERAPASVTSTPFVYPLSNLLVKVTKAGALNITATMPAGGFPTGADVFTVIVAFDGGAYTQTTDLFIDGVPPTHASGAWGVKNMTKSGSSWKVTIKRPDAGKFPALRSGPMTVRFDIGGRASAATVNGVLKGATLTGH